MRGTVAELRAAGHEVRPCRLTIEGDLPHGSGLSSSAALEAALCLALLEDDEPSTASSSPKLCSRVENDQVGAQTGLLDQLAVAVRRGRAARCGSTSATSRSTRCRSSSATGRSSRSTRARRTSTPAAATTSAARECAAACEALGIASLRDARPAPAACPSRWTAACATS